ncbi:MAG TPA: response regulator [Polyangiaceae bacterium]|nr:response regulator [Polyangiaceae bacterium]
MSEKQRSRVLIVDDNVSNRLLLRAHLENEHEVLEAADGPSALSLVERTPVDLVLLDVMMPGMNGMEVCRRLKENRVEYLPVLLLTALGERDDRLAGLESGADDFLSKPVDRQELLLRVRTFLRLRDQDQRIRQQLKDLGERDETIQLQLDQLRAVDAMKDDLVSLLVHDLRNPLAGIMGFLGMLAEDVTDQDLRSQADMALEASSRLREILEDILSVRMLESGNIVLRREWVEARRLVSDAIGSVSGAARARQVEISAVIDRSDIAIQADRKLVRRAIENLLSNAVKYSPSGSVVRVAVRPSGDEVQIEVADRGQGIPNNLKEQLFQKFGSVESARGEARRGVGLGLYLVKLVATAHGGRTLVRDRRGGGTAVGLLVPGP